MRIVTKFAMLALLALSFIALNNCGHQSGSTSEDFTADENGPAADYAIYGAAVPLGYQGIGYYPGLYAPGAPLVPVETDCTNGVDDDGDGFKDCSDDDCQVWPRCSEFGPPITELENSRARTIYPNGILVPED